MKNARKSDPQISEAEDGIVKINAGYSKLEMHDDGRVYDQYGDQVYYRRGNQWWQFGTSHDTSEGQVDEWNPIPRSDKWNDYLDQAFEKFNGSKSMSKATQKYFDRGYADAMKKFAAKAAVANLSPEQLDEFMQDVAAVKNWLIDFQDSQSKFTGEFGVKQAVDILKKWKSQVTSASLDSLIDYIGNIVAPLKAAEQDAEDLLNEIDDAMAQA